MEGDSQPARIQSCRSKKRITPTRRHRGPRRNRRHFVSIIDELKTITTDYPPPPEEEGSGMMEPNPPALFRLNVRIARARCHRL